MRQAVSAATCFCPKAHWAWAATDGDAVIGPSDVRDICWDAGAVTALMRCCPGLSHVSLPVLGGPPVVALAGSSALTHLGLYVDCADELTDQVGLSVATVAALSRLRSLDLKLLTSIHPKPTTALLALTQLTNLARFNLWLHGKYEAAGWRSNKVGCCVCNWWVAESR